MENDDVDRHVGPREAFKAQRGVAPWPSLLFLPFAFGIDVPLRLPHIPRPPLYIRSISRTSLPWSISFNPLQLLLSRSSPLFINRSQLVFISSSAMGRSKSLSLSLSQDFAKLMQFCFLFWYRGVCLFEAPVLATDFCWLICEVAWLWTIVYSYRIRSICLFVGWSGLGFWLYFRIIH